MSDTKEQPSDDGRAKLSLDIGGLDTTPAEEIDPSKLEAVSEAAGFTKRETAPKIVKPETAAKPVEPKPATKPKVKQRKRRTTGRTYPFNTKIKPEAYQQLGDIADDLSEEEGRVVSMAEVLENALICYELELKRRRKN
ncbi:MAG: hypothetical protein CMF39_05560 [Legionellaceae bacterium]|nr:hypothetical protein [Legionellaceae bacterium]